MILIINYWVTVLLFFILHLDYERNRFEEVTNESNSGEEETEVGEAFGLFMSYLLFGTWVLVILNSIFPIDVEGFYFYILGTFLLPVLYAIEIVWFEHKDIREKVVNSFTFKVISLIAFIALSWLYSTWIGTDLELLTKVPSGVFNEYQALVVSVLIIFTFVLTFHFLGLLFLIFYMFRAYKQKTPKQYMRTFRQMFAMYTLSIGCIAYTQSFLFNANELYVDTLYENYYYSVTDMGLQDMCPHLTAPVQLSITESNQIILEFIPEDDSSNKSTKITAVEGIKMVKLPSGAISTVEVDKSSDNRRTYRFDVVTCPISS
ncbi:hypothetical protein AltI4_00840 [Alteromonas sp. I4]|nr:hypothetical protein AltI4_00840 [Alteromonas sp. I4]